MPLFVPDYSASVLTSVDVQQRGQGAAFTLSDFFVNTVAHLWCGQNAGTRVQRVRYFVAAETHFTKVVAILFHPSNGNRRPTLSNRRRSRQGASVI